MCFEIVSTHIYLGALLQCIPFHLPIPTKAIWSEWEPNKSIAEVGLEFTLHILDDRIEFYAN